MPSHFDHLQNFGNIGCPGRKSLKFIIRADQTDYLNINSDLVLTVRRTLKFRSEIFQSFRIAYSSAWSEVQESEVLPALLRQNLMKISLRLHFLNIGDYLTPDLTDTVLDCPVLCEAYGSSARLAVREFMVHSCPICSSLLLNEVKSRDLIAGFWLDYNVA